MKYSTILILFIVFLMILFAGLNWELFTTSNELNLLLTKVEAPLGVIMLVVVTALCLVFLIVVGTLETGALLQNRRSSKALEKARKLADSREVSRYNELNEFLQSELKNIDSKLNDVLSHFDLMKIDKPPNKEGNEGSPIQ